MQDLWLTLTWADALVESRTSHMQSHQIWQPPTRIGADRYENYLGGGKSCRRGGINQTNPWKAESSEFSLFLVLRREENQGDQQRIILSYLMGIAHQVKVATNVKLLHIHHM